MKRILSFIIYPFSFALALSATLSSCDDDDLTAYGPSFQTAAQQDAQGTFEGTFYRVQVGTTDTLEASGTFTITATDTLNRARITYASEQMDELAKTEPIAANIAHADQGYTFFNRSGDNALLGRVTNDRTMSASFTKAVRSGRKTVRYNYIFEGKRQ
ncbi:MAG: hypothetical protein IJT98_11475 [Prevotella sp.]|nr:hypothetical protein [Prevotella sp.]